MLADLRELAFPEVLNGRYGANDVTAPSKP